MLVVIANTFLDFMSSLFRQFLCKLEHCNLRKYFDKYSARIAKIMYNVLISVHTRVPVATWRALNKAISSTVGRPLRLGAMPMIPFAFCV